MAHGSYQQGRWRKGPSMLPGLLLCRHRLPTPVPGTAADRTWRHTKSYSLAIAEPEFKTTHVRPSSTKQFSDAKADLRVVFSGHGKDWGK